MRRFWGGLLCLGALMVIALPVQADEVEDLKREVQALKEAVAALKAEKALEASSVEKAVDEYLARRAEGEGNGEMAGWMDGNFSLNSAEGDFTLRLGGRVHADLSIYEPDGMQNNGFDLRRVRFYLAGNVADGWGYKIQTEVSTGSARLKDAWITADIATIIGDTGSEYFDGIQMKVGQFKAPFSHAKLTSSNYWDTVERPVIVNALAPGRDVGLQFSNSVFDDMLYYAIAITNGTNGPNDDDEFWYTGRVAVAPFADSDDEMVKNLHFGLSFATAHTSSGESASLRTAGGGPYGVPGDDDDFTFSTFYPTFPVCGRELLWSLDAQWWWECLSLKFEFLYATQEVDENGTSLVSDFGDDVDTMGGYIQAAYMITGEPWKEKQDAGLELVGQIEYAEVDPGGDVDEGDYWVYTVGANYYFNKNVRFMINWVATDFGDDTLRPVEEDSVVRSGGLDHNLLLRLQLVF